MKHLPLIYFRKLKSMHSFTKNIAKNLANYLFNHPSMLIAEFSYIQRVCAQDKHVKFHRTVSAIVNINYLS